MPWSDIDDQTLHHHHRFLRYAQNKVEHQKNSVPCPQDTLEQYLLFDGYSFLALCVAIELLFDAKHDLHGKRSQLEKPSGLALKSDD